MNKQRLSELDGLRGLAAIGVVLYHYSVRFGEKFSSILISKHFFFEYGQYGVDLFFSISGFVIFMSAKKGVKAIEFARKRFRRLFPIFWSCMIVTFFTTKFFGPPNLQVNLIDFLINFTMIPTFFGALPIDGVYWTLKVELFFYLVIFVLLIFNLLDKIAVIGFLYLSLSLAVFAINYFFPNKQVSTILSYYYYGLLFLVGVNFYLIYNFGLVKFNIQQLIIAAILSGIYGIERYAIFAIIIFIFILIINKKINFLATKVFIFLGNISYALYLIHQNIGYTIINQLVSSGIRNYIVLLTIPTLVSIILAWIATMHLESRLIQIIQNRAKSLSIYEKSPTA